MAQVQFYHFQVYQFKVFSSGFVDVFTYLKKNTELVFRLNTGKSVVISKKQKNILFSRLN